MLVEMMADVGKPCFAQFRQRVSKQAFEAINGLGFDCPIDELVIGIDEDHIIAVVIDSRADVGSSQAKVR